MNSNLFYCVMAYVVDKTTLNTDWKRCLPSTGGLCESGSNFCVDDDDQRGLRKIDVRWGWIMLSIRIVNGLDIDRIFCFRCLCQVGQVQGRV